MTLPLPTNFDLSDSTAIITGGAGLLGYEHARALLEVGASVVLFDIDEAKLSEQEGALSTYGSTQIYKVDITDDQAIAACVAQVRTDLGSVDILINNAASDPKVSSDGRSSLTRVEDLDTRRWEMDLSVGLTGAFLCSKTCGSLMAGNGGGVILNIASDLSVISPDQRLYRQEGLFESEQPVKPISYSVVKTGLIGLTRYLATYWADSNVRVNALSPGGVFVDQPGEFVQAISARIPLGRMARSDEYRGAVQFLCSEASSYLTGQNIVIDGGRTVW